MNQSQNINKKDQIIISLSFLFGLLLPNNNFFYYFVPIIILFLAFRYYKLRNNTSIQLILLLLLFCSFLVHVISKNGIIENKGLLRNIVLIELIILTPFVKNVKIKNIYLYFALLFIFISQISYMLNFSTIISFFNNYYPYEGEHMHYQSEFLKRYSQDMSLTNRSFRLGGMFHNPNECAKYLNILLAVFLIENHNTKIKWQLPFLSICILGTIATGSRTGFFISVVMLLYSVYIKSNDKKRISKYLYLLIIPLVFALFIFIASSDLSSSLRFLDYNEGLEKSLFSKAQVLINYLSFEKNVLYLLFGNFTNDGWLSINFDSEWGELIYRFGFLFLIAFIIFFFKVNKVLSPQGKMILFVLLWTVSNTVIFSYRSSFVFMLLLSKYYSSGIKSSLKKSKM